MSGRNLFLLLWAMSAQVACQASSDGQPEPQEDGTGNAVHELTVGDRPAKSNCVQGFDGIDGHWKVPDFDTMALGYNHYHQQVAPHRFWLDDVVIDSKPVGCPTKP